MKLKLKLFLLALLLILATNVMAATTCTGRIMNPVTDVSWISVFPISIGPARVANGQIDAGRPPPLVCVCPISIPPFVRPGVGVSYWEPARVAEVVRRPFCSPSFGGIPLADLKMPPGTHADDTSFYHVHWLQYPLLAMMELVNGLCVGSNLTSVDMMYMTELDPLWMDDELSFLINPEAALFASLPLQAACTADCLAASAGFPLDELFWCAGCNGAMYPMAGTNSNHIGGLQSSLLMIQRIAAKLHRQFIAMDTSSLASMCMDQPAPILPKRQYKTQVFFPIPRPETAHPMGRTSSIWGAGQQYPVQGENWAHIIWRKNTCCAL